MPFFPHTYALHLPAGYTEDPEPGVSRTPFEDGFVKQSKRQSTTLVTRPFPVLLRSSADYQSFLAWYNDTIDRAGWFDWIEPGTQAVKAARIVGGRISARSTRKHADRWIVEMQLEAAGAPGAPLSDIGVAGGQGFGVGRYPGVSLPAGFSKLAGTDDSASAEFGNYQYSDGSIMCWVPAFYYKWGTGSNGLAVNACDVKPFHYFTSVAAANAAGYALHRAFYDGGEVKKGFFVDKYLCSNNGGVASSIALGAPLSSHASHNPFSGLDGAPSNAYWAALVAAKTRGPEFFCSTRFIFAALALLSYAHGQAATSATHCAWYDGAGTINFPKGNNNNALADANDGTVTFTSDGFDDGSGNGAQDSSLTGSGTPFAKTTHNGQACGVCDLNGNMWEITPGLATDAAGAAYYVLKTSVAMKDVGGGNTLDTDLWGAAGIAALYDSLGATFQEALATSTFKRFGNGAAQVISEAVAGTYWQWAGLGAPLLGAVGGTNAFGQDGFWDYRPANMCPISGANWNNGSNAGVWALYLANARTDSNSNVGFRAASYL